MVLHLNPHLISFQTKELWVWHCSAKGIKKFLSNSRILYMNFEGLWEMFKGDSADICGKMFPPTLKGGRADSLVCAYWDQGPPLA